MENRDRPSSKKGIHTVRYDSFQSRDIRGRRSKVNLPDRAKDPRENKKVSYRDRVLFLGGVGLTTPDTSYTFHFHGTVFGRDRVYSVAVTPTVWMRAWRISSVPVVSDD